MVPARLHQRPCDAARVLLTSGPRMPNLTRPGPVASRPCFKRHDATPCLLLLPSLSLPRRLPSYSTRTHRTAQRERAAGAAAEAKATPPTGRFLSAPSLSSPPPRVILPRRPVRRPEQSRAHASATVRSLGPCTWLLRRARSRPPAAASPRYRRSWRRRFSSWPAAPRERRRRRGAAAGD